MAEILIQRDQLREGLVECKTKLGEQTARVQRLEKKLAEVDTSNNESSKVTLGSADNMGNRITFGSWNLWFDEKASIMSKNGDVNVRQHEPERKEKVVFFSALLMAFLMVCAQIAHISVKNPFIKYVPSFCLLVLSLFVAAVDKGLL